MQSVRTLKLERAARDGNKVVSHRGMVSKTADGSCVHCRRALLCAVPCRVGTGMLCRMDITGMWWALWSRPGQQGPMPLPHWLGTGKPFKGAVAEAQGWHTFWNPAEKVPISGGVEVFYGARGEGCARLRANTECPTSPTLEPGHPVPLQRPAANLGEPCPTGHFCAAGRSWGWTFLTACLSPLNSTHAQ